MTTTNRTREYGGDVTIPRNTEHLLGHALALHVEASSNARIEISDAAAITIAAGWQGPTGSAMTFTSLTSHFPVSVSDLHDAIYDAQREIDTWGITSDAKRERLALNMLATWAVNGPGVTDV